MAATKYTKTSTERILPITCYQLSRQDQVRVIFGLRRGCSKTLNVHKSPHWKNLTCQIAGGYCLQQTSSPNLEAKEDNKTTVTFREKKTLSRAALGRRTERDDFRFLHRRQQVVVMVTAGCGHGDSRLWSWWSRWQQVVVIVVMVTAGCGHGDSRLWSWWSWWQQVVVMVVMATAGCGHGDSRLWSWWSWRQQVVVMRLRTSHNRLNAHMFKKMKLAASPTCNCGLEDQTAEHILQRCPLLRTARTNVWPAAVQVYTPLYGSKEELEKTAAFILQAGLSV